VTRELRTGWGARVVVLGGGRLDSIGSWIAELDRAIPTSGVAVGGLLMDFRAHPFAPSAEEAGALLDRLRARFRATVPPVAAVARPGGQFGGTRVLCTLAEMHGCRASAFLTEAEAWLWLRAQLQGQAVAPLGGSNGDGEQRIPDTMAGGGGA